MAGRKEDFPHESTSLALSLVLGIVGRLGTTEVNPESFPATGSRYLCPPTTFGRRESPLRLQESSGLWAEPWVTGYGAMDGAELLFETWYTALKD